MQDFFCRSNMVYENVPDTLLLFPCPRIFRESPNTARDCF